MTICASPAAALASALFTPGTASSAFLTLASQWPAHHPFYFHRLFDRLHRFFLSFRCFGHFGCADLRCCYFLQICFGSDHLIFSGAPHIKQIQPERIGNDTDTAQAHGRSAKHWIQRETKRDKQAGGQRDADSIVEKCPEQILMDISQRGSAQGGSLRGTSLRRLFISTTSAASMATSVPAPIAMPISARVRAGASLIPSPTMATLPCSCS